MLFLDLFDCGLSLTYLRFEVLSELSVLGLEVLDSFFKLVRMGLALSQFVSALCGKLLGKIASLCQVLVFRRKLLDSLIHILSLPRHLLRPSLHLGRLLPDLLD